MDKTPQSTTTVLPPSAAQIIQPTFCMDFQVQEKGSLFGGKGQNWREFAIHGQQLTVSDKITSKILLTFSTTAHVTLQPQSGHEYLLLANGKTHLTLFCPSPTRLRKFESVLRLSASTPHWVLPPQDILQDLVDVATTIVETCSDPSG
ncbi:Aste57867_6869 [Aphanomyces stellatus]|uniref:Aste57867_6869 protein n=1 Tax=Aphanomyces stellatus TaxID=120398 RepID=A0A485KHR0_9STRA|nr:hypothetical protein As57867_006848 [Aphanomyces stellatus]VFT83826.1 Aste57867_6869 [Aphanomyces stellatus]